MEMRATEDIAMAEDLTPPHSPLAFCLHDSFLSTHCSACSLPLPNSPLPPFAPNSNHAHSLLYCSLHCSSLDSSLHFSSSEHNLLCQSPSLACPVDSSSARLSLRLLNLFLQERNEAVDLSRIAGLATNYEKLVMSEGNDGVGDDVLGMIKEGAAKMILAGKYGDDMVAVAEAVMCLVLTNAVEVQDKNGRSVGIAVYDTIFSWINHSCSPNASYSFTTVLEEMDNASQLRIYPASMGGCGDATGEASGDSQGSEGCGSRIIVRSLKRIKKDEEVTITYTDLLQPKELRQSELRAKYQFNCCCKRCSATPATYVDRALQEIIICSPDGHNLIADDKFYRSNKAKNLMDSFDNAVDEYLTFDNPETSCMKLEELLAHCYRDDPVKPGAGKSPGSIRLHQFHHLSLNAYTTLASAYRVRASDLLASDPENHKHQAEALNMSRISAAYSLLLAVFTHHLFLAESSLIASAANYWRSAGESLVYLSRGSMLDTFQKLQPSVSESWFSSSHKCYQIAKLDRLGDNYVSSETVAEISGQFLTCIVNIAEKVWNFLSQEGHHLNEVRSAIDFRGLLLVDPSPDFGTHLISQSRNRHQTVPRFEANGHPGQESVHLLHLGIHCIIYGLYLSNLCCGKHSYLASDAVNFLYREGIFSF